ncbi:MAG: hypothetical protein JXQ83_00190 [Candidatus Glassbacteria bacterium]|nr:hypothetical protein [Candidatus Glassbacteria bacterium]
MVCFLLMNFKGLYNPEDGKSVNRTFSILTLQEPGEFQKLPGQKRNRYRIKKMNRFCDGVVYNLEARPGKLVMFISGSTGYDNPGGLKVPQNLRAAEGRLKKELYPGVVLDNHIP